MPNPLESPVPEDDEKPASPASGGIAARALAAKRGKGRADYFDGLNPEQVEAVETLEGPVLVLAGAGTGKTRVLTTRIAHILATGRAWPSQILAVTFTNKAAREMKVRVGRFVGEAVEGMPWLGTFHSIGAKILRRNAELVGLRPDFTILDTDDQIRLLKQLIRAEGIDDKRWPARQLAAHIDGWKNNGLGPEQISEGDARAFGDGRGRDLYQMYQERLKILNACDFGDLLLQCITLFRENHSVLAEFQKRFRYILVDEYQDTNTAQYMWLRLLAQLPALAQAAAQPLREGGADTPVAFRSGPSGETTQDDTPPSAADATAKNKQAPNICCVGDDDQSIYGWRGAQVDNILRFEKDFPGAKVVRLERNYRSTAHILATASHLISHNEGRLGKTLFTDDPDPADPKVKVTAGWDSEEEARSIGEEIEQLQRGGHDLNEMAILVRASFQMREFESRFGNLGLNYRVIGGPRFYERMEIRDAMAYFRVVCQPADDLAFERIINTPKRGIGEATLRIIHDNARAREIPLLRAARELMDTQDLKPKVRSTLKGVLDNFARWREELETLPHNELAEMILEESGYTEMWQNNRAADAPGRLENLKELVNSMDEFESLSGFLEHVSLVMDVNQNEDMDAVSLMTLHSAKGLEFDTVFLPGWEEGLFPHQRSLDENGRDGLEEERRLAYVGLTRARQRCYIWFVSNRRIHGLWQSTIPSRFVDELPEAHVETSEDKTSFGGYGARNPGTSRFDTSDPFDNTYATPGWQRAKNRERGKPGTAIPGRTIEGDLTASSFSRQPSNFTKGQRVFHQKFGNGNIASIDGNKLTIDFDKAGQKRVLDSFVEAV